MKDPKVAVDPTTIGKDQKDLKDLNIVDPTTIGKDQNMKDLSIVDPTIGKDQNMKDQKVIVDPTTIGKDLKDLKDLNIVDLTTEEEKDLNIQVTTDPVIMKGLNITADTPSCHTTSGDHPNQSTKISASK